MILKVQGDFGMADFAKIVGKISPYFKFIYSNETMYIALKDIAKKQEAQDIMSKTFIHFIESSSCIKWIKTAQRSHSARFEEYTYRQIIGITIVHNIRRNFVYE